MTGCIPKPWAKAKTWGRKMPKEKKNVLDNMTIALPEGVGMNSRNGSYDNFPAHYSVSPTNNILTFGSAATVPERR